MSKIFTTSYSAAACELITALIKNVRPQTVVEIGCQQGRSTVAIANGMELGSKLISVDLFEEKYNAPPYLETHASLEKTLENLKCASPACQYEVRKQDGIKLAEEFTAVDALHVDICNHAGNLRPILQTWHEKVNKLIILEGGIRNNWQQKYGFEPYREMLREGWLDMLWDATTIPFNDHNAFTIMARKPAK